MESLMEAETKASPVSSMKSSGNNYHVISVPRRHVYPLIFHTSVPLPIFPTRTSPTCRAETVSLSLWGWWPSISKEPWSNQVIWERKTQTDRQREAEGQRSSRGSCEAEGQKENVRKHSGDPSRLSSPALRSQLREFLWRSHKRRCTVKEALLNIGWLWQSRCR